MRKLFIIIGALIFFLGGCVVVAIPVLLFTLPLALASVGGMLVGILTVFFTIVAWDRWA